MRSLHSVVTFLIGCGFWTLGFTYAQEESRPNILLILTDDLGYGDVNRDPNFSFPVDPLSPGGGTPYMGSRDYLRTPNMVRFAEQGMRAPMAYAPSAICSPSRASIFLGRQVGTSPLKDNNGILLDNSTFAHEFVEAGYDTVYFGKWGLGTLRGGPWDHGFQEFFGQLHNVEAHFAFPKKVTYYNADQHPTPRTSQDVVKLHINLKGNKAKVTERNCAKNPHATCRYVNDLVRDSLLNFLKERVRVKNTKPFLLIWAPTYPHFAYYDETDRRSGKYRFVAVKRFSRSATMPRVYRGHAAQIEAHLDVDMGMFLDFMNANPELDEKTLVIFTSDNGATADLPRRMYNPERFGSQGGLRGSKKTVYEGGLRVPFILRWKNKIQPASLSRVPFALYDLAHTFREVAGLPAVLDKSGALPGGGTSMLQCWLQHSEELAPQRLWLHMEFCIFNDPIAQDGCYSATYNISEWQTHITKLVVNPKGTSVFELISDPLELAPLHDIGIQQELLALRNSIREPVTFPKVKKSKKAKKKK